MVYVYTFSFPVGIYDETGKANHQAYMVANDHGLQILKDFVRNIPGYLIGASNTESSSAADEAAIVHPLKKRKKEKDPDDDVANNWLMKRRRSASFHSNTVLNADHANGILDEVNAYIQQIASAHTATHTSSAPVCLSVDPIKKTAPFSDAAIDCFYIAEKQVSTCIVIDIGARSGSNAIALIKEWQSRFVAHMVQHPPPRFIGILIEYSSHSCAHAVQLAYENHMTCIYVVSMDPHMYSCI